MADYVEPHDGLAEIDAELPLILKMIVRTARWVHPDTFRALPIWYPEHSRYQQLYDAAWVREYTNTDRETGRSASKKEGNVQAQKALRAAIGAAKNTRNWTVCHIWGVDDATFQSSNVVVRDPKYYSCVGNMVWLPTPLKAFTDSVPAIKDMLRSCAFHLYGWACEHAGVKLQAERVRSGALPECYPVEWPAPERRCLPPGTAPCTAGVLKAVSKRKAELRRLLADETLRHFPRDQVRSVLAFWRVDLERD